MDGSDAAGRVSPAGTPGNAASLHVSLSGDGRLAAFSSLATNLVPGNTGSRRTSSCATCAAARRSVVSVSATGAPGDGLSQLPALSPDGRFVVFDSFATNFVPHDSPLTPDLFLRELRTGGVERVVPDVHVSGPAALSDKAREVAFSSLSAGLVPGDANGVSDAFVRERR